MQNNTDFLSASPRLKSLPKGRNKAPGSMQRSGFGQAPGFGASTNGTGGSVSNSFGQGMASQQSMPSFSFGQPQSGGLFGATAPSQSFPPANGPTATDNNASNASFPAFGGNTSFNFGASAPSSGFTFSAGGGTSNPFANLNGTNTPPTPTFQPSTNLFSAGNQPEKPNIFASSTSTGSGGLFGQPANIPSDETPKNKPAFTPNDDAMHTSPDRSATKPNPGAFSFLNPSQPTSSSNSLFTKPNSFGSPPTNPPGPDSSKTPSFSFGKSTTATPQASSLDKAGTPPASNIFAPAIQNTSNQADSQASTTSEKTAGLFGSISRPPPSPTPSSTPATNTNDSQLFGGLSQSSKPIFGNVANANTGSTAISTGSNSASLFGSSTPKAAQSAKGLIGNSSETQPSATEKSTSLFNFGSPAKSPTENVSSGVNANAFPSTPKAGTSSILTGLPGTQPGTPKNVGTERSQVANQSNTAPRDRDTSRDAIAKLQFLNTGLLGHLTRQDRFADWSSICKFYLDQAAQILNDNEIQSSNTNQMTKRIEFGATSNQGRATDSNNSSFINSAGNFISRANEGDNSKRKKLNEDMQSKTPARASNSTDHLQNNSRPNIFSSDSSSLPKTSETASIFKSIVDQPSASFASPTTKSGFGSYIGQSTDGKENKSISDINSTAQSAANPFASIKFPSKSFNETSAGRNDVNGTPKVSASPAFQPPKFNVSGSGSNFMGQFGQMAAKENEKEKEKRKLEEFDSDEDDEAEWERKDAERQKAKKAKIEAETANAKNMKAKFVNNEFVFESSNKQIDNLTTETLNQSQGSLGVPKAAEGSSLFSRPASPANSTTGGTSVFNSPNLSGSAAISNENIFAHLSDVDSGAEGRSGKEDDDSISEADLDDEGDTKSSKSAAKPALQKLGGDIQNPQEVESDDGESLEDAMKRAQKSGASTKMTPASINDANSSSKGGLFDRIQMGANGKPERDSSPLSKAVESNDDATTSKLFGQGSFGKSVSTFGKPSDKDEDRTWKADSPIKFGASSEPVKFGSNKTPSFSFTPATPASLTDKSATAATSAARPFGNLFGTTSQTSSFGSIVPSQALSSSKPSVGFTFGTPKASSASLGQPAGDGALQSTPTSRGTTPDVTTDAGDSAGDSNAEGDAPALDRQQRDLTALSETEIREEEVLFDGAKGKAIKYEKPSPDAPSSWVNQGVGPVRLLKSKSGGVVRILMRQSPSGKIVINTRLMAKVSYTSPQPKIVQVPMMSEGGQMSTWIIRFGTDEEAKKFLDACEKNKA